VQPDEPGDSDQVSGDTVAPSEWSVDDFDADDGTPARSIIPDAGDRQRQPDDSCHATDSTSEELNRSDSDGASLHGSIVDQDEERDFTALREVPPVFARESALAEWRKGQSIEMPGSDPMFDDTFESVFEGGEAGAADIAEDEDAVGVPEFASFTADEEFASFTGEHYVQTTTQEFVDLASDMARMSMEEHVPSPVAAEIPGLQTGLVGLDDVVTAAGQDPAAIPPRQKSDLALRVFTGMGLAVIFFASLYAPLLIGLFVLVILLTAGVEFFSTLVRSGYRPLGLFGLLGTVASLVGTWIWGPIAVPISIAATLVASLLFFGIVAARPRMLTNTALTVLGAAWIGGLGAFIFDMVRSDLYGWLIVATVVTVSMMDVAQYAFGRRIGRHRLAPAVSPKKTVEGLVCGVLVALLVGVTFGLLSGKVGFVDLHSPIDLGAGLALGLAVAVASPFGDLAVSLLKRSIGVKDMGTMLPGHGGLLDRVDAMLFAIPLAWIVFAWTGLLA
jgi:phosphatidate cytidylyltransferase